jgi:CheY-like chemotaxis protein
MKTILIVEHNVTELETLLDICRLSSTEFTILTSRDEENSQTILSDKHIDLILCSTTFPQSTDYQVLETIARGFPYIPIIAVVSSGSSSAEQPLPAGASSVYNKPYQKEKLLEEIARLLERSSYGTIKGIPIHSFLQMFESEGKTRTLHVFSGNSDGLIFIKDGKPINAKTGLLTGEEAIYEIISWNEVIIDIRFFNGLQDKGITKPLISLIMEAFRLKDERETQKTQEQTIDTPQHKLEQVATAGQRLALDIGLRMKLEFDEIGTSLESVLIGMIPGNCIITTTPSHFIVTRAPISIDTVIIAKFMYMGKLCLFRSRIIKAIDSPQHMLFLEYPSVIHYHEMRKAKRTAIYIPCTINTIDGTRYSGAFRDLSSAGGLCQVDRKGNNNELLTIQIAQPIVLNCVLPGLLKEQKISGVVQNFKRNNNEVILGIEFTELPPSLKETIERYLDSFENILTDPMMGLDKI